MVRLKGQMICVTAQESAAVQANVAEHIRLTLAEPGCLSFEVEPTDDPMVWEVMETFRTMADFHSHQVRTRDSVWLEATQGIARAFRVEEIGD